jgi:4-hydroxy-tetrahydrodipicolinate reductase
MITGALGHMGRTVARLAEEDAEVRVVAGVDKNAAQGGSLPFPMYADPMEYGGEVGVIVDFSAPDALPALLRCCLARKIPLVLCTTGHSAEELRTLREASRTIPVFRTGNLSLGINLLAELVRRASAVLGDGFDVEILERHHRRKADAPSGTAIMLANAASEDETKYIFERNSRRGPRVQGEIGISSVRGGTIVGEHEVIFAGTDEVIELRHSASSRDVFAVGALRAAKFMAAQKIPGMYDMTDALASVM